MGLHAGGQARQIVILNVPPILAQMHGDAVGSGAFGQQCRLDRVRIARAASLTKRRDMIDIDAEMQGCLHTRSLSIRCAR